MLSRCVAVLYRLVSADMCKNAKEREAKQRRSVRPRQAASKAAPKIDAQHTGHYQQHWAGGIGSLLMENRGGKQTCVASTARKILEMASNPKRSFESLTLPYTCTSTPAPPLHNAPTINMYNLTCEEVFCCFMAAREEGDQFYLS